jgi:DNA-binding NtrC family response regulator
MLRKPSGDETLTVTCGRLRVTRGPDKGLELDLGARTSAVIGTDPDADLVLHDDSISRRHAELRASEDGYVLRDLGSTNGIRVGGTRVIEALLDEKTTFTLGETTLTFTLSDEAVEHELSARRQFGNVLGSSAAMRQLFAMLERAAPSDSTVLLEGESGTGKEAVAESLHKASPRASGPFIVVDCAAIPASLMESELFGHMQGAFTGAQAARAGAIEEADGGTLFLDEIGDLPLDLQPKLLRALEKKQVKRVGAVDYKDVDFRVVAATNVDLAKAAQANKFRSDLYYRLAVVRVTLPALRHRVEDIAMLARHFLATLGAEARAEALLTSSVLSAFSAYAWPGNVRELRNAVERLVTLGELAQPLDTGAPLPRNYHDARRAAIERFEHSYCRTMLSEHGGMVTRAAAEAGISRQMFGRLLRKHGIEDVD